VRSPVPPSLAAAGFVAGVGLAVWAGWIEPRRLVVREQELALPHWPARLSGLRAGVLSDLHAGVPHVGLQAIRRAIDELNAREPDVHLLLGDYLDASQFLRRDLAPERVAEELARLRAPLGTIAPSSCTRPAARSGSPVSPTCVIAGQTSARRCATSPATCPCSCSHTTPTCSPACRRGSR
jgi:hypothetical protein